MSVSTNGEELGTNGTSAVIASREPSPATGWFGDLSRRAFLRRGTLTAAAVGVVGSVPGLSGLLSAGSADAPAIENSASQAETDVGSLTEPLVAHVKDISTGEISLFRGAQEIVVRDPALARRLLSSSLP
jgi:hypothetical protein